MFFQNRNIFNILFEAIPEGVIIVDEAQTILAANSSAESMFGYNEKELSNKKLDILIPKEIIDVHKHHFSKFINSNNIRKITHNSNLRGVKKNNTQFPIEIGLNPFSVENNNFVLALLIDITLRKKTEKKIETLNTQLEKQVTQRTFQLKNTIKQLKLLNLNYKKEIVKRVQAENKIKLTLKKEQELSKLKTKFLTLVSHEFKTPLSGILTSTMLLNKYQLKSEQNRRAKHIKTIESKVHYLDNILNDFLSVERLDANEVNYKITKFNLSNVINEVVYNTNILLKSGQKINIPQNIDNFILQQDKIILELILSNLMYNAVKYSPENSTIDVKIIKNGKNISFAIIDTGIGIPLNDQNYIFNRYFRAENALNTQGTGIGLSIVKAHVENLGGTISFKSKEHKGSVFTLKLPIINNTL
ncbi:ATP-binding protein [Lutibacter sp.]|uniref:PAS domain-containing sensor histidine kinase n=1 Tax=Lutibacter sp. TaxID=1925666 RepID=UPI0034A0789D